MDKQVLLEFVFSGKFLHAYIAHEWLFTRMDQKVLLEFMRAIKLLVANIACMYSTRMHDKVLGKIALARELLTTNIAYVSCVFGMGSEMPIEGFLLRESLVAYTTRMLTFVRMGQEMLR